MGFHRDLQMGWAHVFKFYRVPIHMAYLRINTNRKGRGLMVKRVCQAGAWCLESQTHFSTRTLCMAGH